MKERKNKEWNMAPLPEAENIDIPSVLKQYQDGEIDLICILGPTASGKTRYAVAVAREIDKLLACDGNAARARAEIISGDSRQVYRGMDIGTGKDLDEYGDVPYHLIDIAPAGSKYNIYTDGLKIYTTIDSRMQSYAEDAVLRHLGKSLQPRFIKEKKGTSNPYTTNRAELSAEQRDRLIDRAIRQSERHRVLKLAGLSEAEIRENFNQPREMRVFSYDGDIDTIMSPLDSMLYSKSFLRTGMMSMDPVTGYVKAYIGGPNFKYFQYDMVSQGRRQIGSTIKPFLYTYAMEEGYTPCDEFLNSQPVLKDELGRPWIPRNSGHTHIGEMVTLRWALTNSNNWISARLMDNLSPAQLVRNMHNFGITNYLDPVKSICLGSCDVSVKEMVTAYSAFANKGMRVDPVFVTRITDNQGNVISEFVPQHTECISEEGYYKILSILLNVVDSGTGNRVRRAPYKLTAQMGGKTGRS